MTNEDFRALILGEAALEPPFEIVAGGKTYVVSDSTNVFVTGAYPDVLCIALPKEGMVFVRFDSISAVHAEHQAVASGIK